MSPLNILLSFAMAGAHSLWCILWAWVLNQVFGLEIWYEVAALVGVPLLIWLLVTLNREEHNYE